MIILLIQQIMISNSIVEPTPNSSTGGFLTSIQPNDVTATPYGYLLPIANVV